MIDKIVVSCQLLVISCCLLSCAVCYAQPQPVTSSELIEHTFEYNAREVSYKGEIVGDILNKGDYAWVNVYNGSSAVGVWLKRELANDLTAGSYKYKGTEVEVTGIFYRACRRHGGDFDIHAQNIIVLEPGYERLQDVDEGKKRLVLVLCGGLLVIWILMKLKKI